MAKAITFVSKQRKRVLVFVRKHGRIVTFLGALIVFMTFVTKDVWRERIKDSSDSLQSDSSFYVLRFDHENLQNQLSRIELQTRGKGLRLGPNDHGIYYDFAFILDANARWPLYTVRTMQYHLRQLFTTAKLGNKQLEEEMTRQENRWSELQAAADKLSAEMYDQANLGLSGKPEEMDKISGDFALRTADASYAAHSLVVEQSNLGSAVLKEASEKHEKMEKDYQFYTKLSYFLYTIGWGLGFFGHLIGVEESAAGK